MDKSVFSMRSLLLLFCCCCLAVIPRANSLNCTTGRVTFERTPGLRLPGNEPQDGLEFLTSTAPTACYRKCLESSDCEGYYFDHEDQRCVLVRTTDQDIVDLSRPLEHSSAWSYHRKICLGGKPCHRQWAFDRIPGVQLFGYDDKPLTRVLSRDLCLERCSSEENFVCRSARYDRHNRTCVLSRHDRRTAPEAFRRSSHHVEYMENQCITEPSRCTFHQQSGLLLQGSHAMTQIASREECERACVTHSDFTCRSFEYDASTGRCQLSPDDSHSAPASTGAQGRYFYERGSCIEVQMHCEATSMTAVVKVVTPFRGRLYAAGHPYECYAVAVRAGGEVALTMPLRGRTCGTRNLGNGTFVNSVVVQHHPLVLRSTDRRIDVACDYEEVQRKLRGGKEVIEGELHQLTQTITGLAASPPVRLRVVNAQGQEVRGAQLGEQLFLRLDVTDETVFGIFGSGLFARSGQGTETVLLIDDRGCPVEPAIFPALERDGNSKSLMAPFQAFRFASESAVRLQITVSFCLDQCAPVTCTDEGTKDSFTSFGRRRKRSSKSHELQAGDIVTDVTMETPLFVVSSGKPTSTPSVANRAKDRYWTHQPTDVLDSVKLTEQGVCLSRSVLYIVAVVGSILQAALLATCTLVLVLVRRCRRNGRLTYGCESVSSRQQLCEAS